MIYQQIVHISYKIRLIANLLKLFKSRELAEEVLQDLFLKIWEQRERIDPSQSLNAYLYKVANNMVYVTFRKIARDKKLHEHLLSNSNIHYDHIEKTLFKKENQEELNKAIMLMPLQQQTVFKLCKIEEKSYQEVSELLNITVGTINNHIYRANFF